MLAITCYSSIKTFAVNSLLGTVPHAVIFTSIPSPLSMHITSQINPVLYAVLKLDSLYNIILAYGYSDADKTTCLQHIIY